MLLEALIGDSCDRSFLCCYILSLLALLLALGPPSLAHKFKHAFSVGVNAEVNHSSLERTDATRMTWSEHWSRLDPQS